MSFCRCGKFALVSFNRILMSLVSVVVFSWILRGDLLLYPKCLRCVDISSYLRLFFYHLNVILSWCFSLVESVAMLSPVFFSPALLLSSLQCPDHLFFWILQFFSFILLRALLPGSWRDLVTSFICCYSLFGH